MKWWAWPPNRTLTGTGTWKHLSKDTGNAWHTKHWKPGWKILCSPSSRWQANVLANLQYLSFFFFNDTQSLSTMNHYHVPKKCPERSHHFLKPSARVKRWGLVDLAELTQHSSLTSKKHRWRIYVCPLPVLTKAKFSLWTSRNHCAPTPKKTKTKTKKHVFSLKENISLL